MTRNRICGALRLQLLALCVVFIGACSEPPAEDPGGQIQELLSPDLGAVEGPIREQLVAMQELLASRQQDPETDPEQLADAYGDLGTLYWAYGLDAPARAALENARTLDPASHRWRYYLGFVYFDLGLTAEAAAEFEAAAKLKPDDLPTLVSLAQVYLEQGDPEAALVYAQRILDVDIDNAVGYYLAGSVALMKQDHDESIALLTRALELQPEASRTNFLLAQAYRGLGDEAKAFEHAELAGDRDIMLEDPLVGGLEFLKLGSMTLLRMGSTALADNRIEDAVAHFTEAVAIAPKNSGARLNLGAALSRLGRLEDAREQFRLVLETEPANSFALMSIGLSFARSGDDQRAIEYYEKALESEPGVRNAELNLGNALRRGGRCTDAIAHYARAVVQQPEDSRPALGKAECEARLGDFRAALATLEAMHERKPDSPMIRNALARVLALAPDPVLRDGERAIELAQPVVQAAPILDYVTTLAMAFAEAGRFDDALRWQQAALDAATADGQADLMAELQQDLDRYRAGQPASNPWDR